MKTNIILLTVFSTIVMGCNSGAPKTEQQNNQSSESISISGAFALYPLAVKWAEEFKKIHPNVQIDISAGGAGKGITDVLSGVTDIALVSRDLNPEEVKNDAFPIAVTKDAVLPTISANNPILKELKTRGVKKEELNGVFITGQIKSWSQLNFPKNDAIRAYTRSDAAGAAETWANYFGKKQEDLLGVAVFGDPGLAQAVKKDPNAIGFNNIVYIYDSKTKQASNGLVVLPIDINNNGKIDDDENFYDTIDDLIKAIAAGKYPSPPARNLYFVTKGKPANPIVVEFTKWALTEGQKYVYEAGYIQLSPEKLNEEIGKLESVAK